MKRRALLGSLPAVAATAGCLDAVPGSGPLSGEDRTTTQVDAPLVLRAMRAPDRNATDVTCRLPEQFVSSYPDLAEALSRADDRPRGEWARMGIDRETGDAIVDALESHCQVAGGLYFYRDRAYFVSVAFTDSEDAIDHHSGDGHEGHNHTHTTS